MAEFDWKTDIDAVVLPHQPQTAVYANEVGQVVVRQEKADWEEYDPLIQLTPQGALAVAWAMIEEARRVGLPEPPPALRPSGGADPVSVYTAQEPLKGEKPSLLAVMEAAE